MKKVYLIAIIMAIITGFVVYIFVSDLQKSANTSDIPTTPVAVAVVKIAPNTVITAEMIRIDIIPTTAITPGTARTAQEIIGKIVKYPVSEGEQIIIGDLSSPGNTDGADLSYQLGKDERAITINVNEITGVSGFIRAGDYVDIITTDTIEGKIQTYYLKENVKVIKVSNKAANLSGGEITSYGSITLVVSEDDVLVIAKALDLGMSLRLTLRPIPDIQEQADTEKAA